MAKSTKLAHLDPSCSISSHLKIQCAALLQYLNYTIFLYSRMLGMLMQVFPPFLGALDMLVVEIGKIHHLVL